MDVDSESEMNPSVRLAIIQRRSGAGGVRRHPEINTAPLNSQKLERMESEVTVEPLLLNGRGHKVKHERKRESQVDGARLWIMHDFTDQVKEYMRERWRS